MKKIYKCCICHEILTEEKPIRLVKQEYKLRPYKQYHQVNKYDFCKNCYKKFAVWIHKNKEK